MKLDQNHLNILTRHASQFISWKRVDFGPGDQGNGGKHHGETFIFLVFPHFGARHLI